MAVRTLSAAAVALLSSTASLLARPNSSLYSSRSASTCLRNEEEFTRDECSYYAANEPPGGSRSSRNTATCLWHQLQNASSSGAPSFRGRVKSLEKTYTDQLYALRCPRAFSACEVAFEETSMQQ
jgi:hypothetical protein